MSKHILFIIFSICYTQHLYSIDAESLFDEMCVSCHNDQVDIIPLIFGQPESYLKNSLFSLQSESREDEIMYQILENLSSKQIDALAEYIAGKDKCDNLFLLDAGNGDPKKGFQSAQPCMACHTAKNNTSFAPWLKGQHSLYLTESLKKFRSEFRTSSHGMVITEDTSDQEIEDIAAYFNSMNGCQK